MHVSCLLSVCAINLVCVPHTVCFKSAVIMHENYDNYPRVDFLLKGMLELECCNSAQELKLIKNVQ